MPSVSEIEKVKADLAATEAVIQRLKGSTEEIRRQENLEGKSLEKLKAMLVEAKKRKDEIDEEFESQLEKFVERFGGKNSQTP